MTATHPLLWYTDRSRYETGFPCPRERLLQYHWGPHGYGINKKAQKIPLATGTGGHEGIAFVLAWVKDHDQLPPLPVVNGGVLLALNNYAELVASRGLVHWDEDELARQRMVDEQRLLIEGMIRAWVLYQLPQVLRDWRIVHVEEEHVTVGACTCGIGDRLGQHADHVAKGCEGVGFQGRADFVAQHRVSHIYSYHELKSMGAADSRVDDLYEVTIQPYIGTVPIEDQLGIEVEQIFIHCLVKGDRDKEYDTSTRTYSGPEYQNSRLVNAYYSTQEEQWAVRYKWTDELTGKGHSLPKHYEQDPLSQYPHGYQHYLETFAPDLQDKVVRTIGPLPRKDYLREGALESWLETELTWRERVHGFIDMVEEHAGEWHAAPVQRYLDRAFPRTFVCVRYGARYKCQFVPICHLHPGWEDPLGLLGYIPRRPHHQPELDQAILRGLLAPENVATEGDDQ